MKKILSLALALIFVLTSIAAIAINVSAVDYENGDVIDKVDFKELYQTLNYTEPKKFNILLSSYTGGYQPIWYRFSYSTETDGTTLKPIGAGDLYFNLTSGGLDISTVYRYYGGIVLSNDKYADQQNYCISITMSSRISDFLYFGWDYGKTPNVPHDQKVSTTNDSIAAETTNFNDFRFDSGNQGQLKIGGGGNKANDWQMSGGSPDDLYQTLKGSSDGTKGATAKYTFEITNGVCKKIYVSTDTNEVVYTSNTGLATADKYLGMFIRTNDKDVESSMLIEKIEVTYGIYESDVVLSNRTLNPEKELQYTDDYDTYYKPGYVLHNMDFSKIESFEDTGYSITNNSTPINCAVDNDVLKVTSGGRAYMLFTSNAIPKNIQNYEVKMKFRFTDTTSSYFAFIQSADLNNDNFTAKTSTKSTCIRYNGTVDNCTADDDTAWAKVVAKYQAGEWVTFTYQAIERYTGVLTFECGGETATLSKSGNTLAVAGQYMGIMFGYGSSVEVANIQIVATDSDGAYENLVWPAEEGALVQNVSADAIGDASSVTTTTEATTTAATTTEAPADETDAPADETTAAEEEKKKGCKSSVALSALAISAIASSAIVLRAKKKED